MILPCASQMTDQSSSITAVNGRLVNLGARQETSSSAENDLLSDQMTMLQPLKAELQIASSYVDEFVGLRMRVEKMIANMSSFSDRMDEEQSGWEREAEKRIDMLRSRMESREGLEERDTRAMRVDIDGLQSRVDSMRDFKGDTLSLEQQLKLQIRDTTQALGILNAKFSAQETNLNEKFSAIDNGITTAIDGDAFKHTLDETQIRYEAIAHNIDDLRRELSVLQQVWSVFLTHAGSQNVTSLCVLRPPDKCRLLKGRICNRLLVTC